MIDIQRFMAEDDGKLSNLYVSGENIYASDGKILIEVKSGSNERLLSSMQRLISDSESIKEWQDVPELVPCVCVDGLLPECSSCTNGNLGDGSVCPMCKGDAIIEQCAQCPSTFENRRIAKNYVILIASLPGAKLGVVEGSGKNDIIHFKFDGGRGCVMPIKHDE